MTVLYLITLAPILTHQASATDDFGWSWAPRYAPPLRFCLSFWKLVWALWSPSDLRTHKIPHFRQILLIPVLKLFFVVIFENVPAGQKWRWFLETDRQNRFLSARWFIFFLFFEKERRFSVFSWRGIFEREI